MYFAGEHYTVVTDIALIRELSRSDDVQLHVPGSAFAYLVPQRTHLSVKEEHKFFVSSSAAPLLHPPTHQ